MSGAALQEAAGARGRARLPPGDLYADYVLSDHPTTQIALSRPTTLSDHPPRLLVGSTRTWAGPQNCMGHNSPKTNG